MNKNVTFEKFVILMQVVFWIIGYVIYKDCPWVTIWTPTILLLSSFVVQGIAELVKCYKKAYKNEDPFMDIYND